MVKQKRYPGRLGLCSRAGRPGYAKEGSQAVPACVPGRDALATQKKVSRPSRPVFQGETPWLRKRRYPGRPGLCSRARRPGYAREGIQAVSACAPGRDALVTQKKVSRPSRPVFQGGTPWLRKRRYPGRLGLCTRAGRPGYAKEGIQAVPACAPGRDALATQKKVSRPSRPVFQGGTPWLRKRRYPGRLGLCSRAGRPGYLFLIHFFNF